MLLSSPTPNMTSVLVILMVKNSYNISPSAITFGSPTLIIETENDLIHSFNGENTHSFIIFSNFLILVMEDLKPIQWAQSGKIQQGRPSPKAMHTNITRGNFV